MPITISGSTGIAGVDGSASTPAVQGTDTNTGISFPAADTIAFNEGGVEAMRIDSSGNVGIGTSSPGQKLDVNGIIKNNNEIRTQLDNTFYSLYNTAGTRYGYLQGTSGALTLAADGGGSNVLVFNTNSSERARFNSSGEFLVGVTSGSGVAGSVGAKGYASRSGRDGSFSSNVFNIYWTGSAALYIDTTNVGTFAFTSDYRIKRNIETQAQSALDRISQLRPVTYKMADYQNLIKASEDIKEGFIAHELAEVIPSAVEGQKDAPNQLQSLKLDALCSVMVKAIQELTTKLEAAEARIATLEAK